MKNELISICIPTYNQTNLLEKTLESILSQTYTNYEVIISDDSTTEDVFNLISKYDFKGRMNYYKNNIPLGSPTNWNKSIRQAKGKYIKILHHDDWFSSTDSLYEFVIKAERYPDVTFFFCATESLNHIENKKRYYIPNKLTVNKIMHNPLLLMVGNIIGAPSVTFFKKNSELFDENIRWLVDLDFYIRIIMIKPNFIFLDKPLVCVTAGANHQITNSCKNKNVEFTEWFYVYNKYRNNRKFTVREIIYLLKLIYKYKINSIAELESLTKIPNKKILTIIIWLSNFIRRIPNKFLPTRK
jgi:glycosyltransferase involved in cell wall biosynthesis